MGENLLGAEGYLGGLLGREAEGLVAGVDVKRLGASEHGSQRLNGGADDVVVGLLCGEGDSCRLGVEAEPPRAGIAGVEALAHDPGPHPASGAELGDLFEEVVLGGEEEGQARGESVDLEPGVDGGLDVGDAVGEGECELLHGSSPCLAHVVAADADGVPAWDVLGAILEHVGDEAHGVSGRVDVGASRDVLLEDVVLQRAVELRRVDALLPADGDVERQEDGGSGVDGHRGTDLVEGDALEEHLHVGEAGYGNARASDLAGREGVVGVVAGLSREVESDAEAGLPLFEEVAVAGVGFLRRGEAGVLAHRPHAPAVHVGLDAAGVGVLAGVSKRVGVVELLEVLRRVDGIDLDAGVGLEAVAALAESFFYRLEGAFVPFLFVGGGHGCGWLVVFGVLGLRRGRTTHYIKHGLRRHVHTA